MQPEFESPLHSHSFRRILKGYSTILWLLDCTRRPGNKSAYKCYTTEVGCTECQEWFRKL